MCPCVYTCVCFTVTYICFVCRYLGEGLATAVDHDAWYIRRKVVDPMFHRSQLQNSINSFNSTADEFVKELQEYAESEEICQLSGLFHRATLDVIMKV